MKIECKNCIGYNRCGDPKSNENGDCSSYQETKHIQEISDDFDDKFWRQIGNQKLTYKIIEWWYNIIRRQMKYAERIGREEYEKEIAEKVEKLLELVLSGKFGTKNRSQLILILEDLKKKLL